MGRAGPKPGAKRKPQRAGRSQGKKFSLEKKKDLGRSYVFLKKLLADNSGKLLWSGKKVTTVEKLFELAHPGGTVSTARGYAAGLEAGTLHEPKKKGPPQKGPESSDFLFFDLFDFICGKIENAKKGSFVTIDTLKRDLMHEEGAKVSKRFLRRTLKRMGFRWVKRKGKWLSRRGEERVQRRLFEFCKWAVAHSKRVVEGGKVRYQWSSVKPIGFQDETSIYDGEFRKYSWVAPVEKGSKKVDHFYDVGKGQGTRVNILHTIFTKVDQPESSPGVPSCLIHWKSSWTGKKHPYIGEHCTGDHIEKYFCEEVFHHVSPGGAVCVDNASTHKVYADSMRDMDSNALEGHIETKIAKAAKGSYRAGFVKSQWKKLKSKYVDSPKESTMREFIKRHHLMDTVLREKGALYDVEVVYLAQYHPEANPIERYWALLKHRYYDTDPSKPHAQRMAEALSGIPTDFVQKCIEKSLKWVHDKFDELSALPKFGGSGPAAAVADASLASLASASAGSSESDSDSDSD